MKQYTAAFIMGIAFVCSSAAFIPAAQAQFTKIDYGKTPSKFVSWVQGKVGEAQEVMQNIQDSQFGQFVGDGIKYTKQGLTFAKKVYEKGQEEYGKIKDSPELEAARISKKIVEESKALKKLQENKLSKQQELANEVDLLKEQTTAKANAVRNNLTVAAKSYGLDVDENGKLVSNAATADLPKIQNAEAKVPSSEIQSMVDDLKRIKQEQTDQQNKLEAQYKEIDNEFKDKVVEKTKQIAELTKKLAETASKSSLVKSAGGKEANFGELKDSLEDKLFTKGKASIKQAKERKRERKKALSNSSAEALSVRADMLSERQSNIDSATSKEDLADTMTGESEGAGINAQVLIEQMNMLQKYAKVILADLKMQTAQEMASLHGLDSSGTSGGFNLCNYTDQDNIGADYKIRKLKETAKNAKTSAASAINKTQTAVSNAKNKAEELKEKGLSVAAKAQNAAAAATDKVKNTVSTVKDTASTVKNTVSTVKDTASTVKDTVSTVKDTVSVGKDIVTSVTNKSHGNASSSAQEQATSIEGMI